MLITRFKRFQTAHQTTCIHAVMVAACLILTACGGDSASSGSTTGTTTPGATTATTPPAQSPSATDNDITCGIAGFQGDLLNRINILRTSGAVCGGVGYPAARGLVWDGQLQNAATAHATDMATNNFFAHQSATNGSTLRDRVPAAGYNYQSAGENIAAGQTSVAQVMADWTNSPSHCANMMKATFRDIGVSCKINPNSVYRYYWVMELGVRQ
jgi:uncharacterized protein YkwD